MLSQLPLTPKSPHEFSSGERRKVAKVHRVFVHRLASRSPAVS
jgi:hypothetical protein